MFIGIEREPGTKEHAIRI